MVARLPSALVALLLAASIAALGTNYEHDGVTTYCWAIPRRTNETKLSEADRTTAYSGHANCPMTLSLSLPSTQVFAFDVVNVTWTVQADFSSASNAINNTRLYYGPDSTGRLAQIVHSNVHSCVFGTGCDPFNDGEELVDKTVNKVANFSDNKAVFQDSLQFPTPGVYSVLAHIILPNFNASSRFDYAVYTRLTVLAATDAPAPTAEPEVTPSTAETSSSSSGLSQGATIAIIVGAVVVVVAVAVIVVVMRRRQGNHSGGYVQAPIQEAGYVGGGGRPGPRDVKHSDVTNTNSTTGYESAWGGPRPTQAGLDNTDYSNTSSNTSNQYAAPSFSDGRPSDVNRFSTTMHQPDLSASAYYVGASTNAQGRKKRVDSDVEL